MGLALSVHTSPRRFANKRLAILRLPVTWNAFSVGRRASTPLIAAVIHKNKAGSMHGLEICWNGLAYTFWVVVLPTCTSALQILNDKYYSFSSTWFMLNTKTSKRSGGGLLQRNRQNIYLSERSSQVQIPQVTSGQPSPAHETAVHQVWIVHCNLPQPRQMRWRMLIRISSCFASMPFYELIKYD